MVCLLFSDCGWFKLKEQNKTEQSKVLVSTSRSSKLEGKNTNNLNANYADLTRNGPRFLTLQEKVASLPAGTVTFFKIPTNCGFLELPANKKRSV